MLTIGIKKTIIFEELEICKIMLKFLILIMVVTLDKLLMVKEMVKESSFILLSIFILDHGHKMHSMVKEFMDRGRSARSIKFFASCPV